MTDPTLHFSHIQLRLLRSNNNLQKPFRIEFRPRNRQVVTKKPAVNKRLLANSWLSSAASDVSSTVSSSKGFMLAKSIYFKGLKSLFGPAVAAMNICTHVVQFHLILSPPGFSLKVEKKTWMSPWSWTTFLVIQSQDCFLFNDIKQMRSQTKWSFLWQGRPWMKISLELTRLVWLGLDQNVRTAAPALDKLDLSPWCEQTYSVHRCAQSAFVQT